MYYLFALKSVTIVLEIFLVTAGQRDRQTNRQTDPGNNQHPLLFKKAEEKQEDILAQTRIPWGLRFTMIFRLYQCKITIARKLS